MKLAARKLDIKDDPKPKDRATWQRLRLLVEEEACHPDWGCALYRLHRTGRIDNDQREAGDRYASLIRDHRALWRDSMLDFVVDDFGAAKADLNRLVQFGLGHVLADDQTESDFETKRAKRIGVRYREARAVAGPINSKLEDMLMDEVWPVGEREHKEIAFALTRLFHFFSTGTKRKR